MSGFFGFSRVMRELLIRETLLGQESKKAESSRDFTDCQMTQDRIHKAIGKTVASWWQSKNRSERWQLSIEAMTKKERASLLSTLLNDIGDESDDEQEVKIVNPEAFEEGEG